MNVINNRRFISANLSVFLGKLVFVTAMKLALDAFFYVEEMRHRLVQMN